MPTEYLNFLFKRCNLVKPTSGPTPTPAYNTKGYWLTYGIRNEEAKEQLYLSSNTPTHYTEASLLEENRILEETYIRHKETNEKVVTQSSWPYRIIKRCHCIARCIFRDCIHNSCHISQ